MQRAQKPPGPTAPEAQPANISAPCSCPRKRGRKIPCSRQSSAAPPARPPRSRPSLQARCRLRKITQNRATVAAGIGSSSTRKTIYQGGRRLKLQPIGGAKAAPWARLEGQSVACRPPAKVSGAWCAAWLWHCGSCPGCCACPCHGFCPCCCGSCFYCGFCPCCCAPCSGTGAPRPLAPGWSRPD